jgi:lipopolysaccharide export system protein LptA
LRLFYFLLFFLIVSVQAEQLKIVAQNFESDDKKGVTVFRGDVRIIKGADELNASVVTIYTDAKRKPTRYEAEGNVSFFIKTENRSSYRGKSERAVFIPSKKEYHFYKNVHIEQIDQKKEITGEEVVVSSTEGTASAKGGDTTPVMMTFDIQDNGDKK